MVRNQASQPDYIEKDAYDHSKRYDGTSWPRQKLSF